jgi:hypothetical protein
VKSFVVIAASAALLAAGSASAHHSAAMFDRSKMVVLEGTFLKQVYANPHVWISVMATADGKGPPARWDIETVGPGSLTRIGITKDTLKEGDKLILKVNPLRDGRNGGSLMSITTPDGKVRGFQGGAGGLAPQ